MQSVLHKLSASPSPSLHDFFFFMIFDIILTSYVAGRSTCGEGLNCILSCLLC